jgi:hypothetical protein
MASADGKSSPFNPDGKSGAAGNGAAYDEGCHRGPDRPQKMGESDYNRSSVPDGGKVLKVDPPSDRGGLVGQTAEGGMKHRPFKLSKDESTKNSDVEDAAPAGDVEMSDGPDMG